MVKNNKRDLTEVLSTEQKKYFPPKKFLKDVIVKDYEKTLKKVARNSEKFWEKAAEELHWFKKWDKVLDMVYKRQMQSGL